MCLARGLSKKILHLHFSINQLLCNTHLVHHHDTAPPYGFCVVSIVFVWYIATFVSCALSCMIIGIQCLFPLDPNPSHYLQLKFSTRYTTYPLTSYNTAQLIMAEITITGWDTRDVRFPTSLDKTGSDAMNTAGDYSAAYCILKTDSKFSGHGMVPPSSLLFS